MKTIIFTYGKFSNNSDLHKLMLSLSTNYVTNKEFILCDYKGFNKSISIDNPLFVRMDDRGYAFMVETDPSSTLEEVIENSVGNLIIVTNFVDYKNDFINAYISNSIEGKKLNFIYYDEKNRVNILETNKYVDSINDSIRFEQLNRLAKKSLLVLKGDKL